MIIKKESGTAIIFALFVVALTAIAAVAIMTRQQIDIRRTQQMLTSTQTYLYTLKSQAWAKQRLINDIAQQKRGEIPFSAKLCKNLPEKFSNIPGASPPLQGEGQGRDGVSCQPIYQQSFANNKLTATIIDQQGLFNLNNLTDVQYQNHFIRLLRLLMPNMTLNQANEIANAIHAWISPVGKNNLVSLDIFYQQQKLAYVASHRLFVSISELRLVKGITSRIYQKLEPYITALPQPEPINVNAMSPVILAVMVNGMTLDQAQSIIDYRNNLGGFHTTAEFSQYLASKFPVGNQPQQNSWTVASDYFLLQSTVTQSDQKITFFSFLRRGIKENKVWVDVLWQSRETL